MSVPFRVIGGAWSVPGYAMKGLYQEMIKSKGKSVQNYIIAARIAQGCDEASSVTQQERDNIVSKWKYIKVNTKKKRNPGAEQIDSLYSLVEEKRKRWTNRQEPVNSVLNRLESHSSLPPHMSPADSHFESTRPQDDPEPEIRSTIPSWRQQEAERVRAIRRQEIDVPTQAQNAHSLDSQLLEQEEAERRELDKAIAASVAEASRGNPEEDSLVEAAIRASIAELERAPVGTSASDDEAALKRAVAASLADSGKTDVTAQEQAALEETLRKSLLETNQRHKHGSESEWDSDDDENGTDDEIYQRVLAESKKLAHAQGPGAVDAMAQGHHRRTTLNSHRGHNDQGEATGQDDGEAEDEDMKQALRESTEAEQQRRTLREKQMTEEDIVMEYVRKQSLLEEQHRRRVGGVAMEGQGCEGDAAGKSKTNE